MHFAVVQDVDDDDDDNDDGQDDDHVEERSWSPGVSYFSSPLPSVQTQGQQQKVYPKSISIDELMKAGKLVKPKPMTKVTLEIEEFCMGSRLWQLGQNITVMRRDKNFHLVDLGMLLWQLKQVLQLKESGCLKNTTTAL